MVQGNPLFAQLKGTILHQQKTACFVLNFIEGLTLREYQRELISLPLQHVKYFTAVALDMLQSLHQQHIIYRDLKPENVMLDCKLGSLVLVDFGFAKQIKSLGRTFTKCGTPGYSAPEVIN